MTDAARPRRAVSTLAVLAAFVVAAGAAQLVPTLPPRMWSATLLATCAALSVFLVARRQQTPWLVSVLLASLLAVSYVFWRADLRLADELPTAWEGRDIELIGVVDELPQRDAQGVRFAFAVERVLTTGAPVPPRVALGWYRATVKELQGEPLPDIHAGERWQLTVRLKRPHGYANPAGFDVEAWLLENGLRATGSVRGDEPNRRLAANAGRAIDHINGLRDRLRERMQRALADARYGGVLIALALGDQRAIAESDWALFNATAVSHLLSISGAHVTLFAAWAGWLAFAWWRRAPSLVARMPAQQAAALVAAVVALAYATLAGFAVPAQRTCYMLLTAALAMSLRRILSPWLILAWSAVVVTVLDPWAALSVGFWFSFGAVAFLLFVTVGRVGARPWWHTVLVTQAAVTIGLAPLSLAFFQQVSLVGPLANAVAIPLVTMLVVPLTLLWLAVPVDALLHAAHQLILWLAQGLQGLLTLPAPLWVQHAPPWWTVALAIAGSLWMLAPRGWPHRWLGAAWCLPLLTVTPAAPNDGEFRLTVLDIGQGTAAVVQTARHTLVYDTGPRWTDSTDAGSRLIAPFLRASGAARIHGLVVSHLDIDHSGGARSLLGALPVDWMLTSIFAGNDIVTTAAKRGTTPYACVAGQRWIWDGVRFDVLHPTVEAYGNERVKTNDRSCVIKVSTNSFSVLLTADIEALSERDLVARDAERSQAGLALRSDVLLMPHHGSLTSSTPDFIDAVAPTLALINAGYRNRFGHPRDAVLARYAERNIPVLRTDWHGAITLESTDAPQSVRKMRDARQRYWTDRPDPKDRRPME
ncbi:MAG: DNA internalization-related competence protein ComEC/Rec2 [Burkholderiales bacterium]|nr:DNA internalization-related competence protein ComEC/Rec2 [Burkholderiales bacterium]